MIKSQRIIKIVERVNVFNNSALGIVEICGKYYLMSFTDKDNKILKELNKEEVETYLEEFEENSGTHMYFDVEKDVWENREDKTNLFFGTRKKD
jgi:hypothetical protein